MRKTRTRYLGALMLLAHIEAGAAWAAPPPLHIPGNQVKLEDTPYFKQQRIDALLDQAETAIDSHWSEARDLIQQAIALDDSLPSTHLRVSDLYILGGEVESALWHLTRYLALQPDPTQPDWVEAQHRKAQIHLHFYLSAPGAPEVASGHLADAEYHLRAAYEALLRFPPASPLLGQVEIKLAQTLLWRRQPAAALRYARAARLHGSDDDATLRFESLLLRVLDQPAAALSVMDKARVQVAYVYDRSIAPDELDEFVYNLTEQSLAQSALGHHDAARHHIASIRAWVEAENTLAPTPQTQRLLLQVYNLEASLASARHDLPTAERFHRLILTLTPDDAAAANNLAWTIAISTPPLPSPDARSRLSEAARLAERAVRLLPTTTNLDTLSEVYLRQARFSDAFAANQAALRWFPSDPYLLSQQQRILDAWHGFVPPPNAPPWWRALPWHPPEGGVLF